MTSVSTDTNLLLGEWACLGVLCKAPSHGFAIAARLKPESDIGRIWTMSRALTYRALAQLEARDLIKAVGEEQGLAGGNRTVYRVTRAGRAIFMTWLQEPVVHVRDMRSELLLKLALFEELNLDASGLISAQQSWLNDHLKNLRAERSEKGDPVLLWRIEMAAAALRFLNRL